MTTLKTILASSAVALAGFSLAACGSTTTTHTMPSSNPDFGDYGIAVPAGLKDGSVGVCLGGDPCHLMSWTLQDANSVVKTINKIWPHAPFANDSCLWDTLFVNGRAEGFVADPSSRTSEADEKSCGFDGGRFSNTYKVIKFDSKFEGSTTKIFPSPAVQSHSN